MLVCLAVSLSLGSVAEPVFAPSTTNGGDAGGERCRRAMNTRPSSRSVSITVQFFFVLSPTDLDSWCGCCLLVGVGAKPRDVIFFKFVPSRSIKMFKRHKQQVLKLKLKEINSRVKNFDREKFFSLHEPAPGTFLHHHPTWVFV